MIMFIFRFWIGDTKPQVTSSEFVDGRNGPGRCRGRHVLYLQSPAFAHFDGFHSERFRQPTDGSVQACSRLWLTRKRPGRPFAGRPSRSDWKGRSELGSRSETMQSDVQSKVAMKLKRKSGLRLVVAVPEENVGRIMR